MSVFSWLYRVLPFLPTSQIYPKSHYRMTLDKYVIAFPLLSAQRRAGEVSRRPMYMKSILHTATCLCLALGKKTHLKIVLCISVGNSTYPSMS